MDCKIEFIDDTFELRFEKPGTSDRVVISYSEAGFIIYEKRDGVGHSQLVPNEKVVKTIKKMLEGAEEIVTHKYLGG